MNKSNLVVVAGGTGEIGNAIADQLNQIGFSDIIKFGTKTSPAIDFNNENSILESAEYIKKKNNQQQQNKIKKQPPGPCHRQL